MTDAKCERRDPHVQPPGFAASSDYCSGRSTLTDGVQVRRSRPTDSATVTVRDCS